MDNIRKTFEKLVALPWDSRKSYGLDNKSETYRFETEDGEFTGRLTKRRVKLGIFGDHEYEYSLVVVKDGRRVIDQTSYHNKTLWIGVERKLERERQTAEAEFADHLNSL